MRENRPTSARPPDNGGRGRLSLSGEQTQRTQENLSSALRMEHRKRTASSDYTNGTFRTPAIVPENLVTKAPGKEDIVIVGAGIIGLSIAYHLVRDGIRVTVLDRGRPGAGCTQGAFAMLISGYPDASVEFNALYSRAILEWLRLDAEFGHTIPIRWGGSVNWSPPGTPASTMEAQWKRLVSTGVTAERISLDGLHTLCPGIDPGPFGVGYFLASQGSLDIEETVEILVARCRSLGVRFLKTTVTGLPTDCSGRATIMTVNGPIEASCIVLAAGRDTTALAATAGALVPLDIVSGTLAHSRPMKQVLTRVINGPFGSVKQDLNGRIVTGLDYAPGADGDDTSNEYGKKLLGLATSMFPILRDAEFDFMTIGHVPIPARDKCPIVGFCPTIRNVYVTTMMSGVTMAPFMGRLAAEEILHGMPHDILSPYRPHRFLPYS